MSDVIFSPEKIGFFQESVKRENDKKKIFLKIYNNNLFILYT